MFLGSCLFFIFLFQNLLISTFVKALKVVYLVQTFFDESFWEHLMIISFFFEL